MMKTMLSTLMTTKIVALTGPSIVFSLTMFCAGAAAANLPEFQNLAPVQQAAASPRSVRLPMAKLKVIGKARWTPAR